MLAGDLVDACDLFAVAGRLCRVLPSTGSTNDDARAWANDGAPSGAVVIADSQSAGRGRHGRAWSSPPGSTLAMSIVLRPRLAPNALPPLSIVVGLGVRDAIAAASSAFVPTVKWPNDVLVEGKKLAGILVEASISSSSVEHAIVGIGVNVARDAFPEELADRATSLSRLGVAIRRADLALAIALAIDASIADRRSLPARLAPHDALRDRRVRLEDGRAGRADGIDIDGRLRVLLDDGALAVANAGEVTLA